MVIKFTEKFTKVQLPYSSPSKLYRPYLEIWITKSTFANDTQRVIRTNDEKASIQLFDNRFFLVFAIPIIFSENASLYEIQNTDKFDSEKKAERSRSALS